MNIRVTQSYHELLAAHDEITNAIGNIVISSGGPELLAAYEARVRNAVVPGLYAHFKSTKENQKLYAVFGVGIEVDTACCAKVCYKALYQPHLGKLAFRPLVDTFNGFLMPIRKGENLDMPEYEGPRFSLVERIDEEKLAKVVRRSVVVARKSAEIRSNHSLYY